MQELNLETENFLEERSTCADIGDRQNRLQAVQLVHACDVVGGI
jgi:hypothetical protein